MAPIEASSNVVTTKLFSKLDFWRELNIATRFGLVGVVATAVHILVVWFLLAKSGMAPISANTIAFLMAFGISFSGNYLWTFRSPGSPRAAMLRFFVIAAFAFAANTLILAHLVNNAWFSAVFSAVLSASVVPVISFVASRLWGFNGHKESVR